MEKTDRSGPTGKAEVYDGLHITNCRREYHGYAHGAAKESPRK
jgi:hypothetical protein